MKDEGHSGAKDEWKEPKDEMIKRLKKRDSLRER